MLLFRTKSDQWWVETAEGLGVAIPQDAAATISSREDLFDYLSNLIATTPAQPFSRQDLAAPIQRQEVWASGVTYFRSRTARMAESEAAGGGDFYDRVYNADRPELFFKATTDRVVGPEGGVRIRRDSKWNVPEPELTLVLSPAGTIIGYTIGNDMSSRDIEGENPLYLPQAKTYDKSCGLGPAILVTRSPLPASTVIQVKILRSGAQVFHGTTTLAEMKRTVTDLASYLFRETSFPHGAFLLTGTGVIPPDEFTLAVGDRIEISIDGIGTLANIVEQKNA